MIKKIKITSNKYKNWQCTEEYPDEEIEQVFYCVKCGGKDEKTKKAINPKRRSTKISK